VSVLRVFRNLRDGLAALSARMPDPTPLTASRVLAMFAVVLMTAILINDFIRPTPAVSAAATEGGARSPWSEVTRGSGAFALAYPAIDNLAQQYAVRRHREGGGRKDLMTWGAPREEGAYVRFALYRPGREGTAPVDPLAAVATLAAESEINAELAGPVGVLDTKFGPLALVDMTLTRMGDEPRTCLAVAGAWDNPRLGLVAWWCNPGPAMVAYGRLACLVERLVLMSAGGDGGLVSFFARAELKRNFCGATAPLLTAQAKRPDDWILAKSDPKLRGALRGR
jgi:hypothetical protein